MRSFRLFLFVCLTVFGLIDPSHAVTTGQDIVVLETLPEASQIPRWDLGIGGGVIDWDLLRTRNDRYIFEYPEQEKQAYLILGMKRGLGSLGPIQLGLGFQGSYSQFRGRLTASQSLRSQEITLRYFSLKAGLELASDWVLTPVVGVLAGPSFVSQSGRADGMDLSEVFLDTETVGGLRWNLSRKSGSKKSLSFLFTQQESRESQRVEAKGSRLGVDFFWQM